MACLWPRPGWRSPSGVVTFKPPPDEDRFTRFTAPCGGCIQCRIRKARDWTIRCTLELHEHQAAAWATLTYADEHLVRPPQEEQGTLYKPHLSGYLKRLRERVRPSTVRFFGVGEYGDQTLRPHYHVILYGVPPHERAIAKAWPFGHVRVDPVTPSNIAYTAGYAQKKIRAGRGPARSYVDPDTGEYFEWQEPFRLCSRRPGIGGAARRHARSWRDSAIYQGKPVPVPRYLHDAWKASADADDLALREAQQEELVRRLWANMPNNLQEMTNEIVRRRDAAEEIAEARYAQQQRKRTKV